MQLEARFDFSWLVCEAPLSLLVLSMLFPLASGARAMFKEPW